MRSALHSSLRLIALSARLIATRWYWALPLIVLVWPLYLILYLLFAPEAQAYDPVDAHWVIGIPMTLVGAFLGLRVIAGEIDRRTLEIAYTVPGGSHRVWLYRLAAALLLLLATEGLLAVVTAVFLTGFSPWALYGPLQSGVVYMVLAMALSTWFRSEIAGAMAVAPLVGLGLITGSLRISPFFNSLASDLQRLDSSRLQAMIVQNRIGFVLVVVALTLLAFSRAERREKMMS